MTSAVSWARADPADPTVEINGIWGLPDALQYCPYDIWEVHVPTSSATDYPEYKSNMLLAQEDGSWKYVRTKNEIARALSVTRKDAGDIAERTYAIARRLGQPCHVMWLVGCIDQNGESFNVPWYWVHAYKTEKNEDRSRHISFVVSDRASLARLKDVDLEVGHYMIRIVSSDTIEIPFTFFGFAEVGQPRGMSFANLGIVVELTLKSDRIVVRVIRTPEQLELPLSLEVEEGSGS